MPWVGQCLRSIRLENKLLKREVFNSFAYLYAHQIQQILILHHGLPADQTQAIQSDTQTIQSDSQARVAR
jgi:hypothetical protein